MRITNNMMMATSKFNINGNKVNVDRMNNQLSSGKKIQRPSEDPIIAIRALRLRGTLSEINQFYGKNIPDADAWLETTDTALQDLHELLGKIRDNCEYGANDTQDQGDRDAIIENMQKLREQIYNLANTDYDGRTIFTGYRTNKKLTFMEDDPDTHYSITERLSYEDIQENRYYTGEVTVPDTVADVQGITPPDPDEHVYQRIRLDYGDVNGITEPIQYTNEDGTPIGNLNVTVYDSYEDWEQASPDLQIADGEAVFIKSSGELILSNGAADTLKTNKASLSLEYDKIGFDKGEPRPEYYHDCTDITDPNNTIEYRKFTADGEEIYQDIEYRVAPNMTMKVNTLASDVLDCGIGRELDEMIDIATKASAAHKKVDKIKEMMASQEYSSDDSQANLEKWLAAAEKEAAYMDSNMQKTFNSYIGRFDDYIDTVELAQTDVGSRGDSLELVSNRMENQKLTVEDLQSNNEDRGISDIIIDYTAALNAYQASLQAGAEINQNTLLNYL